MKKSAFLNAVNDGAWEYALQHGQFFRRPGNSTDEKAYKPFDRSRIPPAFRLQLEECAELFAISGLMWYHCQ